MRIEFVNHSAFILESNGVRLFSDPWLEGTVFNQGWDLVSKTRFQYDDFATVTHIWFSHEHPDHFNPPNLMKIPEGVRKQITVLFQRCPDQRVADHCRKLGFKEVIELKPEWLELAPGLSILCERYQEGDSWLAVRSGSMTLFNTNDCGIRDLRRAQAIRDRVGPTDVLLTQFSYAYWVGNRDQRHIRRKAADEKLEWLGFQSNVFRPKVVIPIASFIWFCHEENFFLNDEINRPQKVWDYISGRTSATPVVLYPGDRYEYPAPHDSRASIEHYDADFERVLKEPRLLREQSVPLAELTALADRFVKDLRDQFGLFVRFLRPARIYLTDHARAVELSVGGGLKETAVLHESCDVSLSSSSLQYCFKFPWGSDTLGVNGRYERPKGGNYSNFYRIFRFNQLKSRGVQVGLKYLLAMVLRKIEVRLGLQTV